ncbi:MAG: hypothetical protein WDO73_28600 [Ignavibacteriota bacterium]
MLRRTCSTYMAQITGVKDVQADLGYTNDKTTLGHRINSVPESSGRCGVAGEEAGSTAN